MDTSLKKLFVLIFFILTSQASNAQNHINTGPYVGGNISDFAIDTEIDDLDTNNTGLTLKGGYILSDLMSVEGRFAKSERKNVSVSGIDFDIEVESIIGLYGKLNARNSTSQISPYIIGGFSRVTLKSEESESQSSASIGVGFESMINDNFSWDLEYMNYYNKNKVKISGLGLGVIYRFTP